MSRASELLDERPLGAAGRRSLLTPPRMLAATYLAVVAIGGLLLRAPFATHGSIGWLDAYFTAMSATTVTGLVVVDTGSTFTLAGEAILLVLMHVGGLGLMTFSVLTAALLGRRIGLRHRILVGDSLNVSRLGGLRWLVKVIVLFALAMELLGTLALACTFVPRYGLARGLWESWFHAVSAFNNAGFSTYASGLTHYVANPLVNLTITALFIVGGIGFVVVADIVRRRSFRRLSLHSKLMLTGTLVINVVAMLAMLAFEWGNPATFGQLDVGGKLWAGWFQGVTPRTAGFNTVDYGAMTDASLLLTMLLMFIGAGTASTGSGIKLSTFIVILLAVVAFLRERSEPQAFGRSITQATVVRALAIAVIGALVLFVLSLALIATEPLPMDDLLFEAVSAFGTVGLSTGITADVSTSGQLILMALMFLGRIGPLTLAFTLAQPQPRSIRQPPDEVLAG